MADTAADRPGILIEALTGLPEIVAGDDLGGLIVTALQEAGRAPRAGQKVGRLVTLLDDIADKREVDAVAEFFQQGGPENFRGAVVYRCRRLVAAKYNFMFGHRISLIAAAIVGR